LLGPIPPGSRELGEPLPGVDGWRNRRRMPLDVARQRARGPGLIAALEPQLRRAPCGLAAHRRIAVAVRYALELARRARRIARFDVRDREIGGRIRDERIVRITRA